ncbi:hypothetical protein [Christiangramia aquimixticola]|uniref:hypothetical protein n=1 Tax=Christiangramia aquimixticola TaxID=1697558 RepID=UPI003AA9070C
MKTIYSSNRLKALYFLLLSLLISIFTACEKEDISNLESEVTTVNLSGEDSPENSKKIIVKSEGMNFIVPREINSGWNTFRYENGTANPHFFVIEKLPEGKTVEDSKNEIVPLFQAGMDLIGQGKPDEAMNVFFSLPSWYWGVVLQGGPGLVSPNRAAESTVYMTPGNYVIECYVKTKNGIFHSSIGMIEGIKVNDKPSKIKEPKSTIDLSISSTNGIQVSGKIRPGHHVVSVYFEDQATYGHFLGHDVHLVKLSPEANIDELNTWMNWMDPDQFKTPAPDGVEFMGGMQELPHSQKGYFSVNLTPGTYAWISEVPDPRSKNMLKTFTVPHN